MTADINDDNEMKQDISDVDQQVDVESYRKVVRIYLDLKRFKTALFWAEKVVVLSNQNPRDIYYLAQCMFQLNEFNRAAHIIRNNGLEKTNLLCLYLLIECFYNMQQYQTGLNLLNSLEVEELNACFTKEEVDGDCNVEYNEPSKSDVLASIYMIKAKILEAMDNRALAIDCYIQALQKSVYLTEALDALMQHEMLMAWEERDLITQIMPIQQQCNDADYKILKFLYESKLKKYYSTASVSSSNPEQTPINIQVINNINEKIKQSEQSDSKKNLSLSTSTSQKPGSKIFGTPTLQHMSPANKILNDLKNTSSSSFSIQSSLSRISIMNTSKSANTTKLATSTIKNSGNTISLAKSLERMENSVDVLVAKAEKCFYNCEFKKCIKIIDEILQRDPYHKKTLFVQIGCLMELNDPNALFYMAHKLVDLYPDEAISWYAVGCYYDLINKSEQARRYLTKAASLDRLFGPAWLAFGHSFAKEKEHDQAMAAYFKATQLMRGCHLPLLYIGVECGLTKNFEMAEKFFYQAMSLAPLDVFVLHELGVIKYESEAYESAEEIFRTNLDMVMNMCKQNGEALTERWEPLLNNLGHCCRKMKKYSEALEYHTKALSLKPLNAQTYTAIGFVHALMGTLPEAIDAFHKSLSLKRDDVVTSTLLKQVLEEMMEEINEKEPGDFNLSINPNADSFIGPKVSPMAVEKDKTAAASSEVKLNALKLNFNDLGDNDSDTNDCCLDMSMDI